jgi:hypothetical protein
VRNAAVAGLRVLRVSVVDEDNIYHGGTENTENLRGKKEPIRWYWCLKSLLAAFDRKLSERLDVMPIPLFLYKSIVLATSLSTENTFSEFGDLGNLLLGGFVLAIVVAVALTFVRLRLREKRPPAAQFISISEFKKNPKTQGD